MAAAITSAPPPSPLPPPLPRPPAPPLPTNNSRRDIIFLPQPKSRIPAQVAALHPQTLHANMIKTGTVEDVFHCNTLIHSYCKQKSIENARQLFDEMRRRNLVSWTSMISGFSRLGKHVDAIWAFLDMVNEEFEPNEFAFGSVLRSCSANGDMRLGRQLHGSIIKLGLFANEFVDSSLIGMYSKNRDFGAALAILEGMEKKDVFSWTSMIVGFSNGSCPLEALNLFVRMLELDLKPDEYALTSVLKSCIPLEGLEEGFQVHAYAIKSGFEVDKSVRISLIDLYAKVGDLCSACLVFSRSPRPGVVMHTVMIGGYSHNGYAKEAVDIFVQMLLEYESMPNEFTYANVLLAITNSEKFNFLGRSFHGLAYKTGHSVVIQVKGALIAMYAKSNNMRDACKIFENMEEKDDISCSSILAGFSSNGCDQEALEFYSKLHKSSCKPDPFSLASVTISCAKLADQLRGKQVHAQIIKQGYESDMCLSTALLDMYARSGTIEDAKKVFDVCSEKDEVAWTAMIDGYAQHGQGSKALDLFNKMVEEGVKPNSVTFVSALYACSHAGLVEEGLYYFDLMSSTYGCEPVLHHYACVVDLLGRAGRLEEALEFINEMPLEPSALVWRSFLGACKIHKNLELGIHASKRILELDPEDTATYVLLANMYASAGCWKEASSLRNEMKGRGIRKIPGLSWLEVGHSFQVFGAGDVSHPQKQIIYKVLKDLNLELKKAGYVPQTELALHQVEELEKTKMLSQHSERLAVVLGLINTPQGSPIRIFKNLRICDDCHNVIKLISFLRQRKIIVRDVSRFHHFSDGKCSCGDYW